MHFHLPKPLHGWREFAGEVGIIVVGVLIALGAEQVVEEMHWRREADKAVDSLRAEVGMHYFQSAEAVVAEPCIDRQLQTLEQSALKAGPYVPVPLYTGTAFQFTYRAPLRTWDDSSWQSVMAEGGASHLDRDLRLQLGAHYGEIASLRAEGLETERLQWSLRALAQPIQTDPATRAHFIEELEQARGYYSLMALGGAQLIERIDEIHFGPPRQELNEYLASSNTLQFCRAHRLPLAPVRAKAPR